FAIRIEAQKFSVVRQSFLRISQLLVGHSPEAVRGLHSCRMRRILVCNDPAQRADGFFVTIEMIESYSFIYKKVRITAVDLQSSFRRLHSFFVTSLCVAAFGNIAVRPQI